MVTNAKVGPFAVLAVSPKFAEIEDKNILDWHVPLRPQFPPGGAEIKCPNCGTSSDYLWTDLLYRA